MKTRYEVTIELDADDFVMPSIVNSEVERLIRIPLRAKVVDARALVVEKCSGTRRGEVVHRLQDDQLTTSGKRKRVRT